MKERIQLSENLGIAKYAVMQNSIVLYTDGSKTSETTGTVIVASIAIFLYTYFSGVAFK